MVIPSKLSASFAEAYGRFSGIIGIPVTGSAIPIIQLFCISGPISLESNGAANIDLISAQPTVRASGLSIVTLTSLSIVAAGVVASALAST